MGIWELKISPTDMSGNDSLYKNISPGRTAASEYSKILDEKISNIKTDTEQMKETQEQLDEINELQEELTGGGTKVVEVETVKRFMPDGSIMVTTYEGGKITEQVRHKPHMTVVPDYSAPPKPDGSVATELKPYQNLDLEMLLMM